MTRMYLPKCTWKPAKTVIIRLYRTAFRVDHESTHSYFIPTIFWPEEPGYLPVCDSSPLTAEISAEGLSLAGKTRGSLGRRKGKKGLLRSSIVADIFPNWPPFFFFFPFSGAWSKARLGFAPLHKSYPDEQSESYQNHRSYVWTEALFLRAQRYPVS